MSHGISPSWASAWGEDEAYGPWAEIAVGAVVQRMRWIPAGAYMMGVAEDEEHFDWETVGQRRVEIEHDFWLFDTPCTQKLWVAVMRSNPSNFAGEQRSQRPVEMVSWEDCVEFCCKLNELMPGLGAGLPTEAQWEYACRAATTEPRYGDLEEIAWHVGNSGGGTRDVGSRLPNRWGLHDMLGNVWEWCADRASPDSAARVIRGGSWTDDALHARAAYRDWYRPGLRSVFLGFRCASSASESGRPEGSERSVGVDEADAAEDSDA